jgi:general secretion pathway protein K
MNSERGMILMSVLWVVFILSLVGLMFAAGVRAEMATAQNSFDSERALYMAKGAAESSFYAISHKQDITNDSDVRFENDEYIFPFDGGEARVRYESTGGKIDLNGASELLLASMFDSVGIDRQTRNQLVDSILDWRTRTTSRISTARKSMPIPKMNRVRPMRYCLQTVLSRRKTSFCLCET